MNQEAASWLSDTLRHVQRGQHLFKNGSFHIGAPQVGLLQITAREVTVLQTKRWKEGLLVQAKNINMRL